MKFLRLPQVLERFPVSKSTLWELIRGGNFPPPCKLTKRTSAWIEEEVEAACKQRELQR